jgi:hypothetical protein
MDVGAKGIMRTFNHLLLASLLALPLYAPAQEPVDAEPEVTIRQEGDKRIEEYRINGYLYAIKVTPRTGKPYYLVRSDGDEFVRADKPDLLIPAWEIFRW